MITKTINTRSITIILSIIITLIVGIGTGLHIEKKKDVGFYVIGVIDPAVISNQVIENWNYDSKTEILYVWANSKDIGISQSDKTVKVNVNNDEKRYLYAIRINRNVGIYINGTKIYD